MIIIQSERDEEERICFLSCTSRMRKKVGCADDPSPSCCNYSCSEGGEYYLSHSSLYRKSVYKPGCAVAYYPTTRKEFLLAARKGVAKP